MCCSQDNRLIVVEQPSVLSAGKGSACGSSGEQAPDAGGMVSSHSSSEEKFSDNISSASEASETAGGSKCANADVTEPLEGRCDAAR